MLLAAAPPPHLPRASAPQPPLRSFFATGPRQSRPQIPAAASSSEDSGYEITEEELVVAEQEMEEDAGAADRGAWAGSWVCQDDLDWLYRTRRIPASVAARLPSAELAPSPNLGEFVVFLSHFQRGFGLL